MPRTVNPQVVISLLRGINLLKNKRVKMDALRAVYESLGFEEVETWLQSGNVVFKTRPCELTGLARRIEAAIEREFAFHSDVILRTPEELAGAVAKNPFAARPGLDPAKLLINFLADDPGADAREQVRALKTDPEELWIEGRELYIYFPNGMGRSKLPLARIEKILKTRGTGRNWTTVNKLHEMAWTKRTSRYK